MAINCQHRLASEFCEHYYLVNFISNLQERHEVQLERMTRELEVSVHCSYRIKSSLTYAQERDRQSRGLLTQIATMAEQQATTQREMATKERELANKDVLIQQQQNEVEVKGGHIHTMETRLEVATLT